MKKIFRELFDQQNKFNLILLSLLESIFMLTSYFYQYISSVYCTLNNIVQDMKLLQNVSIGFDIHLIYTFDQLEIMKTILNQKLQSQGFHQT